MTNDEAKSKLISVARSEIGYHEVADNQTKYASAYDYDTRLYGFDMSGQPWCDYFVDWCFMRAFGFEIGSSMTYQYAGCCGAACAQSAGYYQQHGAYSGSPEVGDQIFFYVSGGINHTGIVEEVKDGFVVTIEGNSSDSVRRNTYRITDPSIAGYGRPAWRYALLAKEDTTPQQEPEDFIMPVLDADGEFGPLTKEAVMQFQRQFGLNPDGVCEPQTWEKIFELIQDRTMREGSKGWIVTALQSLLNYIMEEY